MASDAILRSYGDVSRRESVADVVEYLTAQETQIWNMIGQVKAIDAVHSTLLDTLATPGSLAVAEAEDYTNSTRTTPTRLSNVVEQIAQPISVSRTQKAISHYHGENELARQTTKAMKEWGNGAEYDLVRSTLVSGVSGTVPKMNGLIAHISKSTNTSAQTSGTVWSASILKGIMKDNMDNSNGDTATDVFMGSFLKDKTDDFTNKANNVVTGSNIKSIINSVDVFETGLGKVKVNYHRYVQISTDANARVLGLNLSKHDKACLVEVAIDNDLARSGPYDKKAVVGSYTLATKNQDSNFFQTGFDKD